MYIFYFLIIGAFSREPILYVIYKSYCKKKWLCILFFYVRVTNYAIYLKKFII